MPWYSCPSRVLPLFGGKENAHSIRDIPDWEKTMNFLAETTGEEYEIALSKLPLGIFGDSEYEVLRDKHHHTAVYPQSINDKGRFRPLAYFKNPLAQLDVGLSPDGTGTQIVGTRDNFVNRRFVDAFVNCMGVMYHIPWTNLHLLVRGHTKAGSLPVFLVGDPLSMTIAPYLIGKQHVEPTGKYKPTL